jgi:hypothetical protein
MAVIVFQDRCPTVPFQLVGNCFYLSRLQAATVYKENDNRHVWTGNAIQCLPVAANGSNRGVLNTQVFASCCEASLKETITTYCADLMDDQVIVTRLAQLTSHISHT